MIGRGKKNFVTERGHLQVKLLTIGVVNNLVFSLDNNFHLTKWKAMEYYYNN